MTKFIRSFRRGQRSVEGQGETTCVDEKSQSPNDDHVGRSCVTTDTNNEKAKNGNSRIRLGRSVRKWIRGVFSHAEKSEKGRGGCGSTRTTRRTKADASGCSIHCSSKPSVAGSSVGQTTSDEASKSSSSNYCYTFDEGNEDMYSQTDIMLGQRSLHVAVGRANKKCDVETQEVMMDLASEECAIDMMGLLQKNATTMVDEKTGEQVATGESGDTTNDVDDENKDEELQFVRSEMISKLFPFGHPSAQTEEIEFQSDRSEIISKLFPFGHPSTRKPRVQIPVAMTQPTAAERIFATQCKEAINVGSMILRSGNNDTDGSVESLIRGPPTVDSSTDACEPEDQNVDIRHRHRLPRKKVAVDNDWDQGPYHGVLSSDVIGMLISFDPTWDLLETELTSAISTTRRSRLQKLHEIETYVDSLLGRFADDETSSSPSSHNKSFRMLLEEDANQTFNVKTTTSRSIHTHTELEDFQLGQHFDAALFPDINFKDGMDSIEEVEIVFSSDKALSPYDDSNDSERNGLVTSSTMEVTTDLQESAEIQFYPCTDQDNVDGIGGNEDGENSTFHWSYRSTGDRNEFLERILVPSTGSLPCTDEQNDSTTKEQQSKREALAPRSALPTEWLLRLLPIVDLEETDCETIENLLSFPHSTCLDYSSPWTRSKDAASFTSLSQDGSGPSEAVDQLLDLCRL